MKNEKGSILREVKLGDEVIKLSKAQGRVVHTLMTNRHSFVIPCEHYNHQEIRGTREDVPQFKKPTLDWLIKKNLLVPSGIQNYLSLNYAITAKGIINKN